MTEKQHKKISSEEKLNSIFGITNGKNVDDFLNDLSLDTQKIEQTLESIDDNVKNQIEKLDSSEILIKNGEGNITLELNSMSASLKSIEEMITLSKQIFKHIAENILSSDLLDSELVHACSVLLETIHINIAEFISIYKDKQNFANKIKFRMFESEKRKEELLYKHNLALELLKAKNGPETIEAENIITNNWDQTAITKALAKLEAEQE